MRAWSAMYGVGPLLVKLLQRRLTEEEREGDPTLEDLKAAYEALFAKIGELYDTFANLDPSMEAGPALQELDTTSSVMREGRAAIEAGDDEARIRAALARMREVYERRSAELDNVSAAELFGEEDEATGEGP